MKQFLQPISIVVPTLNEEDNIALLFRRIHATLVSVGIPYEIIVVDDHSTDATAEMVLQAHPKYNAKLLLKQGKPGKAFSLLEGFAAAQHELICMIDGDLQYPPEAIKLMYHKLQYCEADIVLTKRVDNKTSVARRLSSYTFNLLFTRLLFGINYDTQSGLKLFRKSVLQTITIEPSPWTFDLEFIVRALEQNYVIVNQQIPFSERYAGIPKVHLLSATAEIAGRSLKLWRNASTKQVKLGYKQSLLMQRGVNMLLVAIAAALFAAAVPSTQAHALKIDPTNLHGLPFTTAPSDDAEPSDYNSTPATSLPTPDVTIPTASQSQPAAPTLTTTSTQQASGASSSPAVTSTPSTQSYAASDSAGTRGLYSAPSTPNSAVRSTNNTSDSDPSSLAASVGKDAAYYPANKLSSSRTQTLLRLALYVVGAGALFILLGGIVITMKVLASKYRHQPLRA